jgi:putative transposase
MPNHYHLLLSPKVRDGISKFMHKVNMGYSKYFNTKYERGGTLFEGKHKSIIVTDDSHFIHLPYYIHLNPLDLVSSEWRKRKIKNYDEAIEFLKSYRWSSHLDYMGEKNFPSVTWRRFLLNLFGGEQGYRYSIKDWLETFEIKEIKDLTLE